MTKVLPAADSSDDSREAYIRAMWARFPLCPAKPTAPGEVVDLGEIGECREKDWERLTPYSLAKPKTRC
jgi:hypothetical protein